MNKPMLVASQIHKSYFRDGAELKILKGLSLEVYASESVCIMGASGAGKSSLLQILGTLDRPDQGELLFDGVSLTQMNDDQLSQFRGEKLGFIFQFHHLLNEFNVLENVLMPYWIRGLQPDENYARELLHRMGLAPRLAHFPTQLSGGECQRVAMARALVKKPSLILADEPTGNLDSQNGQMIQQLLFEMQAETKAALIVVTHDENLARRFSRRLKLVDGHWVR